jgi:hypothetical protein
MELVGKLEVWKCDKEQAPDSAKSKHHAQPGAANID